MSGVLTLGGNKENSRKNSKKRKNTRNDIQVRCRESSIEIVKRKVCNTEFVIVHINKGIHPRCLLLKGELFCDCIYIFDAILFLFANWEFRSN